MQESDRLQADMAVGTQIDDFVLIEQVSHNTTSTVYRARQKSTSNEVALKIIRLHGKQVNNAQFRLFFEKEVGLLVSLQHEHIVPIYAYGVKNEYAYVAMRFINGHSLEPLLNATPLSLDRALRIIEQILTALIVAYNQGVLHLNLKPSNILLDEPGNVSLCDFALMSTVMRWGQHSVYDLTDEESGDGNATSQFSYMSPEQLKGESPQASTDVYSMGVLFYHLLTGQLPFESDNRLALLFMHLERTPPLPREINPDIPPAIEAIILKALEKSPAHRYRSVLEMARALQIASGDDADLETVTFLPTNKSRANQRKLSPKLYPVAVVGVIFVFLLINFLLVLIRKDDFPSAGSVSSDAQIIFADLIIDGQTTVSEIALTDDILHTATLAFEGNNGFIAFMACARTSEYHAGLARELFQYAQRLNVPFRVYDADADEYTQITQIEQALTDGARGFIVCPLNPQLLSDSFRLIADSNLPLVIFGENDPAHASISVQEDNLAMGLTVGRFAGELIQSELGGEANVVIMGYPDIAHLALRGQGMENGVLEVASSAVIAQHVLGGNRSLGYSAIADLLDQGIAFNVILSINDAGTWGAVEMLQEAGIPPADVLIVSVDAEAVIQQFITDNHYVRGSLAVTRAEMVEGLINSVLYLLAGERIPADIFTSPGEMITQESLLADDTSQR